MRLTKKRAIELTIELWTWLAESSAGSKERWGEWDKYGDVESACFLCEYNTRCSHRQGIAPHRCAYCPYAQKFGACTNDEQSYDNWTLAVSVEERKQYASEFLAQMKELQK